MHFKLDVLLMSLRRNICKSGPVINYKLKRNNKYLTCPLMHHSRKETTQKPWRYLPNKTKITTVNY